MLQCTIEAADKMATLRLLRQVYMKLSIGQTGGPLLDTDGKKVGEWSYEEKN